MAQPYPPEMRERAIELKALGWGRHKIAHELGVSPTTVVRWTDPVYYERQRRASLERKLARKVPCPECGKLIWYTSTRCASCQGKLVRAQRYWTRERIIEAIQEWARVHGRRPVSGDWQRAGEGHPSASGIYGTRDPEFSSWSEALRAAGFTAPTGVGRGNSRWTNEQALALREAGLSDAEIGRRLGVTAQAISMRIGARNPKPKPVKRKRSREQRIADLNKALKKGG